MFVSPLMAALDEIWARFSLIEVEEGGANVPRQEDESVYRLAGKFLLKRVLNVDAVAWTFKSLWKINGELKIRDIGDNVLLFKFDDSMDLERILEFEPWLYDKNLVAFQRVQEVELVPYLEYSHASFWVQFHNVPIKSFTYETGEQIGKAIGEVV